MTDENCLEIVKTRLKFSDYELDGIIITQNDYSDTGFVGGTINPKCSRKFKMGIYDNVAESIVTNINWQISRWGVFTPVLEIEPVEVAGALITNITAHNYENVIKSKCGIGAKIKFKRAGLVIPKLEEVLIPSEEYNLPKCKTEVNGVDLQYVWSDSIWNDDFYREMCIRKMEYFGQKLDIEQLGYGNCVKIYDELEKGLSLGIGDNPERMFFLLKSHYIANLIGENGKKIEASMEAKKNSCTEILFAAACGAFGPDIGERVLQLVWDKYGTLEDMTEEKLKAIPGFGKARIEQYLEYQHQWYMTKVHMELNNYGIMFITGKKDVKSNTCKNFNVCFSGIRVNFLVVKDLNSTSSKVKKATDQGAKIITVEEMKNLVGYNA